MTAGPLTARRTIEEFKKCGITHIAYLPDHYDAAAMYPALSKDPDITLVPVCREGETIPLAAGLWLGGKRPIVMHQCSGFYEAGDSVRGLALDLKLPLLLMLGYRGWRADKPPTDSAATFIEPILKTWGIKYYLLESDADAEIISRAYREANETSRPVAVLILKEFC